MVGQPLEMSLDLGPIALGHGLRKLDIGHPHLGQRTHDVLAADLGEMELRQADLLDGELRHLMSSSVRVSVDRKDTPDPDVGGPRRALQ
jgi:hypothetical protein